MKIQTVRSKEHTNIYMRTAKGKERGGISSAYRKRVRISHLCNSTHTFSRPPNQGMDDPLQGQEVYVHFHLYCYTVCISTTQRHRATCTWPSAWRPAAAAAPSGHAPPRCPPLAARRGGGYHGHRDRPSGQPRRRQRAHRRPTADPPQQRHSQRICRSSPRAGALHRVRGAAAAPQARRPTAPSRRRAATHLMAPRTDAFASARRSVV